MVFIAVIGLIDVRGLIRLARLNRAEFWIAVVVALIGLAAGLLAAVLAGVVITLGLVLRELNRPRIRTDDPQPGVIVVTLLSPLYTANVLSTFAAIRDASESRGGVTTVILDASILQVTSVTVLDAFRDLDRELAETGARLEIVALPPAALALARRTSWWRSIESEERAAPTVDDAVIRHHTRHDVDEGLDT